MSASTIAPTLAVIVFASACASTEKPPIAPTGGEQQTSQLPTPARNSGDNPTKSEVAISDEIRRACGISDADAYFAFDSANVKSRDRTVLAKIAQCFVSGPLSGKQMKLVGHADPRGEEEYNLVLGGRRADNVKGVIVSVGMPKARVSSTSRGALDATGTDEATWARDRRVDIMVGG